MRFREKRPLCVSIRELNDRLLRSVYFHSQLVGLRYEEFAPADGLLVRVAVANFALELGIFESAILFRYPFQSVDRDTVCGIWLPHKYLGLLRLCTERGVLILRFGEQQQSVIW